MRILHSAVIPPPPPPPHHTHTHTHTHTQVMSKSRSHNFPETKCAISGELSCLVTGLVYQFRLYQVAFYQSAIQPSVIQNLITSQCFTFQLSVQIHQFAHSVFNLSTPHTPISPQSINFVVFRLQPLFFYSLLYKSILLWVLIWIALTEWVPTTYAFIKEFRKIYRINIIKHSP